MSPRGLLAALLVYLPTLAASVAAEPGWIADKQTGCRVYNPKPQPGESITWSGACQGGWAHGHGVLKWFLGGKPGETYEGEYREGKLNGHATVRYANGDRFEGEYQDDMRQGHGVEINFDGQRFEGEFRDGEKNGFGRESWSDGDRYEGQWRRGKPDGLGKYTDGAEIFEGTWIDGCFKKGSQRAAVARQLATCP